MKCLLLSLFALVAAGSLAGEDPTSNDMIVTSAHDIPWASSEGFNATRWKDILGGDGAGQIPQEDIRFGLLQLAPNAVYPGHRHAAPEVYYLLSGKPGRRVGRSGHNPLSPKRVQQYIFLRTRFIAWSTNATKH
jgi:hypothetical protein